MDLSIVIPTYNRLDRLKRVLEAFEQQTYSHDKFEIIIVSDGSTDGTDDYVNAYHASFHLLLVQQQNQGPAAARNHGVTKAIADYILFVDDDIVPAPNLISKHMQSHKENPNSVIIGPMVTPDDFDMSPWVQWEQLMLVKQYEAMARGDYEPTARQFYTGNASLLRKYLLESGGFDIAIQRAEDVELAYRLADIGLKFVFNPDAIGYHYAERTFDSWLKIPYAYGCNDVKFAVEKQRRWLFTVIFSEYGQRNYFIRLLTKLCLDHGNTTKLMVALLSRIAWFCDAIRAKSAWRFAYSGIFALQYYQGVADELGGRKEFFHRTNSWAELEH